MRTELTWSVVGLLLLASGGAEGRDGRGDFFAPSKKWLKSQGIHLAPKPTYAQPGGFVPVKAFRRDSPDDPFEQAVAGVAIRLANYASRATLNALASSCELPPPGHGKSLTSAQSHQLAEAALRKASVNLPDPRILPADLPRLPRPTGGERCLRRIWSVAQGQPTPQLQYLFLERELAHRTSSIGSPFGGQALFNYLDRYKADWAHEWVVGRSQLFATQPTDVGFDLTHDLRFADGNEQPRVPTTPERDAAVAQLHAAWRSILKVVHPDTLRQAGPPTVWIYGMTQPRQGGRIIRLNDSLGATTTAHELIHFLAGNGPRIKFALANRAAIVTRVLGYPGVKPEALGLTPKDLRVYPSGFHDLWAALTTMSEPLAIAGEKLLFPRQALHGLVFDGDHMLRTIEALQTPPTNLLPGHPP